MHNAVQGFMVLALWNGNGLLSLRADDAAAWVEAYKKGGEYHLLKLRLDGFLSLYKKIKMQSSFSTIGAGPFPAKPAHGKSMNMLNRFRNEFIHFTPKGRSLQLSGLPQICMDTLEVVEFFGWNSTAIQGHDEGHVERAKRAVDCLRRSLMALNIEYGLPAKQKKAIR